MTGGIGSFATRIPVRVAMAVTVGSVALGMLTAAPAVAAHGPDVLLELSRDGVHYAPGSVKDIFADSRGYVPGESRPGTVWVRNASPDAAHFSLAVANNDHAAGSVLPAYLKLQVDTGTHRVTAGVLPAAGSCNAMIESWTMSGNESLRLDLDLNLAVQAPNATRNQESNFDLVFVLQGIGGGQLVSPCIGAPAELPETSLPPELPANVSVGTAPVASGTTTGMHLANAETGADLAALPVPATDLAAAPQPQLNPGTELNPRSEWQLAGSPQSNVAANSRSPWPWLVALSAGVYMVISFRRRKRTQ